MSHPHVLTRYHGSSRAARAGRHDSVNPALTPNRARRPVENDEYAAFARRILRAYTRRIATGDIDALTAMTDLSAEIDTAIGQAVTGLRGFGYSWADIGTRFGITRQAAQQRWPRRPGLLPAGGSCGGPRRGRAGPAPWGCVPRRSGGP